MIWIVLGTVATTYVIIVAAVYLMQSRMIYFPTRDLYATPAQYGLKFEDLFIDSEDGKKIHGWYVPADSARATVIFCHGNAGNISHRLQTVELFNQLNLSVLIFDYQGYGKSEGSPTENGTYRDAQAAWDYLINEKNISSDKIIIYGRSLGGAIAAHLAKQNRAKALMLESAFSSLSDLATKLYPYLPIKLISKFKYDTAEHIRQIKLPVLIIHSPNDEIIPFEQGQKLYDLANEPKQFLEIRGPHNDSLNSSGKHYIDGIVAFLDKYLPQ